VRFLNWLVDRLCDMLDLCGLDIGLCDLDFGDADLMASDW
jgi:hypothetical protein